MTLTSILKKFREEYRKAYKGIFSDEILEKGNEWFESFLQSKITIMFEEIEKKVDLLSGYGDNKFIEAKDVFAIIIIE